MLLKGQPHTIEFTALAKLHGPIANESERFVSLFNKLVRERTLTFSAIFKTYLFAYTQLIPVDTDDEEVYLHFSDAFICSGRVTNVKRLMSFHPLYLDAFMNTESFVMDGEGPLPFDWRYYIGILVCSCH